MDGVVGQAFMAVALGDFAGQHRAGGAVDIADLGRELAPARRDRARLARLRDQRAVENAVELVILLARC